jgi:hypothetical protein
MGGVQSE